MDNKRGTPGLGLAGVLTLIFIVLKCVGVINWSWWWVLSPTLIALVIDAIVVAWMIVYISYNRDKFVIKLKKKGGKKNV